MYTSIDDAFATLMQYMSTTTRQCKVVSREMLLGLVLSVFIKLVFIIMATRELSG